MSNIMNLAIQISLIDMLSGVSSNVKNHILSLGDAGQKVKEDFEKMQGSITKGLKAIAISSYAMHKALPGVKAAGDLQEAMLGVKMNIASSAKDAKELTDWLSKVKVTAIKVSADAPFSAEDVVRIQNSLLKAGLDLKDVIGDSGAAFAATALASLSKESPEVVGDALANIGTMFKFKGGDYKEFSDWLTRVDDAAATNLPALLYGLRMSGSAAAALGISAKDSVTALGALAPLGERAGSSFNNFLMSIATNKKYLDALDIKAFENGKFIGLAKFIDTLKEKFGKIKDDGQRLAVLIKIFGEEGGRAANTFINAEKGFKDIEESAKNALSMSEKMSIWSEGLNASLKKLAGTAKSTLASIFEPLLLPLKGIVDMLNAATSKLGEFAEKNKAIATTISGGIGAVAIGAGAYGLYNILKGGVAGARVLKTVGGIKGLLKDFGGTATGIAQGKAIEAATGVMPVFVTNWPSNLKGSDTPTIATELASKAGILKKLASFAPVAIAGKVALATAGGYAVGTGINYVLSLLSEKISDGKYKGSGWLGDIIYDLIHKKENPEVKNNIPINIYIQDSKVKTESSLNTVVQPTIKRGEF